MAVGGYLNAVAGRSIENKLKKEMFKYFISQLDLLKEVRTVTARLEEGLLNKQ